MIKRKFPLLEVFADQTLREGSPAAEAQFQALIQAAEAYFIELCAMAADAVQRLLDHEKHAFIAEYISQTRALDNGRFFSEPFAAADTDFWSKISYWTVDEAVALSFGKDPRVVTWERIEEYAVQSGFVYVFAERRELVRRAIEAEQLLPKNTPPFFLAWAHRTRFFMPENLIDAVSSLGHQIADWKTEYDKLLEFLNEQDRSREASQSQLEQEKAEAIDSLIQLGVEYFDLAQKFEAIEQECGGLRDQLALANSSSKVVGEKPLTTRERNSLLKLVAAMASKGYKYDPRARRSEAVPDIVTDLELCGVPLDDETVRKYLREAIEVLPQAIGD